MTTGTAKRTIEAVYPLSPMQQGMLFHSLYAPDSGVYVEQVSCTLRGALDVPAFEQAWQRVAERHAVLRTAFAYKNLDKILQVVQRQVQVPLAREDWRGMAPDEQQRRIAEFLAADRARGFDLARAPLTRLHLAQLADERHHFVWTHHHILLDGWSLPMLLQEVFTLYDACSRGVEPHLPPARPYRDYITWLQRQDMAAAEQYWRRVLAGFGTPTPLTVARPAGSGDHGYGRVDRSVGIDTTAQLQSLARQHQLTLNTLVQGAWALVLQRYSSDQEVVFGATVSGRPPELPGIEHMIGLFINTLPVRVQVDEDQPLLAWLQGIQAQQVEMRQYEYTPLFEVQRWSAVPHDQPLFESILIFENYPVDESLRAQRSALQISDVHVVEQTNYPLTVAVGLGRELGLTIAYDRARFDPPSIERMMGHLVTLLAGFAAGLEQPLADLPLLTPAEQRRMLVEWNATTAPFPDTSSIHALFEQQAARNPHAVALHYAGQDLSYGELNARANQLARRLRALGVGPDTLVGICIAPCLEMIVGMLGVLKAGGAYIPLDPNYPAQRLQLMLDDARPPVVLTSSAVRAQLPPHSGIEIALDHDWPGIAAEDDHNLDPLGDATSLAYVIFTSGSTGRPKGVLLQHRGLVNLALAQIRDWALGPGDTVLQFASFGFDASVAEICTALLSGARLELAPRETLLSIPDLLALIQQRGVTHMTLPPSLLAVLPADELAGVRTLASAGERLPVEVAARWVTGRRFINAYGPTEVTVGPCWQIISDVAGMTTVPIGKPIPNVQIVLLDPRGRPVPVGVPGELHVGGVGLARGYLNRPELTAERFITRTLPGLGTVRLYRTGDLARYREDGTLEYLDRIDFQVKIRGFRIELGEIESLVRQQPGVRDVAVIVREDQPGAQRLVAYVVPDAGGPAIDGRSLRAGLKSRLPEYMVPAAIVVLAELPLSPNGKVNRKALPAPDLVHEVAASYIAPQTPEGELLASVWEQLLGVARVGARDNFFELGGHSLLATRLATRVRDVFGVELPLRAIFEAPTLDALAMRIADERRAAAGISQPPLVPAERGAEPPLSFAQQRLWFLDQLEPESPLYNIATAVRLSGALDIAAIEHAINTIIARHEVLRTVFAASGGRPYQVILPELRIAVPLIDLRSTPAEEQEAALQQLATAEARTPFNLARGPLLRVTLVQLADQAHVALLTIHHIVADGWSVSVLIREVAALYSACAAGQPDPLPALPVQYADYALWQRGWLAGEALATQLAYWKQALAGAPEVLSLPTDRPRPPVQSFNGAHLPFALPQELSQALAALGRARGVTPFMLLLAAFQTLLYRYSGQDDICVGTPIAGRARAETEPLIGFFVNTLVLRSELRGDMAFTDLLARVREAALGAYAHQDVPFEMLVEALQPARNLSHTPLFQVMLVLDNAPVEALTLPGLTLSPVQAESGTARFDMTLELMETPGGLRGSLEYNRDLFDQATMERFLRHFEVLLAGIAAAPETTLDQLPLLTAAERHTLLVAWNQTDTPLPPLDAWHQLFEQQARATPDALAVRFQGQELTYAQLDARANQLAHHLRAQGVGPEVLVGVCTARSLELVVGILGTLKAGGAFLPLDPSYPAERLAFMLEDARPRVVLTQRPVATDLGWLDAAPGEVARTFNREVLPSLVLLDAEWPAIAAQPTTAPDVTHTLDQLAYVIFTSGSTGRPKGTLLHHHGLLNLAVAQQRAFAQQPGHRIVQFSALSFDASVWELVMALSFGAALILAPQDQLASPPELLRLLRREQITTATLPPSLLAVLPADDLPDFSTVIAAGEACSAALVASWSTANRRLFNAYGPTETTVCATMHCTDPADPRDPPIGRPLPNFRAYVLDPRQQPVPIGVPGELVVAGIGVARGYLNRPELTREKFIPDPAGHAERAYRTGDLVRFRPDGTLEFLGRIDHQVKLRGFRIELGEIEAALRQQPGVQDALVLARDLAPGDTRLVAYLVGSELPDVGALRAALRTRLPEFMLPAAVVALERWPLTPGGKIDRQALPLPGGNAARAYVAPRTPEEEILATLCAQLLGVDRVGIEDNFFELGGHSLLATQLLARVQEHFGVEVPLRTLFEQPTVTALAGRIAELRAAGAGAQQAISAMLSQIEHLSEEEVLALLAQQDSIE